MEARVLLPQDGRAYAVLRAQEAEEGPPPPATELRDERTALARDPAEVLERYLASGTVVWGAYDGTTLAGALGISRRFSVRVLTHLWVWGMYVRPQYRGTPASRMLMTAALGWCERQPREQRVFGAYDVFNVRAYRFCERYGIHGPREGADLLGEAKPPGHTLVECVRGTVVTGRSDPV